MDFIERLLDLSPDGGNGSVELAYCFVTGAAIAGIVWRRTLASAVRSIRRTIGRGA